MRVALILILILLFAIPTYEQDINLENSSELIKQKELYGKADSIIGKMSIDEKIGQLIMVGTHANNNEDHKKKAENLISKYHIGGLIFFKGFPTHQAKLTNYYQKLSKTPLFIAIDGEWGVSMRLDSIMDFPRQMTLGAINNDALIYEMGRKIADQCKLLGIHINFAPVIDINNNSENPVIHTRSFGENKEKVSQKGYAYMKGLQENGVIAVAKHFPGHGDTDVDSHKDLPIIKHSKKRLSEVELYPFRYLIENDVEGIMVAHLNIPTLDNTKNIPSTLSKKVVNDILIEELKFNGIIFTDAMQMKGVTKYFNPGEAELKALLAGNDILVMPQNVEAAVTAIKSAILDGTISESYIDNKVRKIIFSKLKHGLYGNTMVNTSKVVKKINSYKHSLLKRKLIESAITLVQNEDNTLPVQNLESKKIVSLAIGPLSKNKFQETLELYADIECIQMGNFHNQKAIEKNLAKLKKYNTIIISLHNVSRYNVKTFGLSTSIVKHINSIAANKNVILVNMGSPYALKLFPKTRNLVQAYENDDVFQHLTAQAIFGGIPFKGSLPVSVGDFKQGDGIFTTQAIRLKYTIPEETGVRLKNLKPIDSIANYAIKNGATPGCQVLVAKEGKIIYHKSYGYHTYEKKNKVKNSDIYDIASISKIAATLLPIMHFYETGELKLNDKVKKYFNDSSKYKYSKATIKNMLLHEAGFEPWIAFYHYTLENKKPIGKYYRNEFIPPYTNAITENLYTVNSVSDTIWRKIYDTKIKEIGKYRYSDLDFIFLKRIVDSLSKKDFPTYLNQNYYSPLGMHFTCFNPYKSFNLSRIVPTEDDKYFRKQIVHGYVHDPAAAMLGGVAGHAGLFSNANDLAKYVQMLLNGGTYGGDTFFVQNTIDVFTSKQSKTSRRGLGFDKPEDINAKYSPTSKNTPESTFGHTGFTGTCAWGDPKNEVIYIFLSNRTFPDSGNKNLLKFNTRTEIQKVIYEAIRKNSTH